MNYQEMECGSRREYECRSRCGCCSLLLIAFFAMLLAVTVGLILGAVLAETILAALAAVIVLAVSVAAVIAGLLIWRFCECRR